MNEFYVHQKLACVTQLVRTCTACIINIGFAYTEVLYRNYYHSTQPLLTQTLCVLGLAAKTNLYRLLPYKNKTVRRELYILATLPHRMAGR